MKTVLLVTLTVLILFGMGTCVNSWEKHDRIQCVELLEERGYKIYKIERTYFSNGPFWPIKEASFFRLVTDKGVVRARLFFGWTFRKDTGEEIP